MSTDLTIFKTGAIQPRSADAVRRAQEHAARITQGISAGFGKVTYKGARWGIRYQGQNIPLVRYVQGPNGQMMNDGPQPFLDCVLLEAAERGSKIFYEGTYREGDTAPPDCWSSNGITPDAGAPKKQSNTCAGCKWNQWGSRISNDPTVQSRGKQCADHKRLAITPAGDIPNKAYGGPLLLQVPPTSLKAYKTYVDALAAGGYLPSEVWTRISFDPQSAYPLFIFDAFMALTPEQLQQVEEARDNPVIDRILTTEIEGAEGYTEPPVQPANVPPPAQQAAPPPPVQQAAPPPPPPPPPPEQLALPLPPPPPPPVAQPDPLTIPAGLDRRVETAAPPVNNVPPPPPGVSPEEWAVLQRMRGAGAGTAIVAPEPPQQEQAPRRRRARSAPVSPQPQDTTAQTSAVPNPPMNPAPLTGQGNGTDHDAVAAKISAMVDKLL